MHRKKTSFPSAAQTCSQHMHAHISVCHCLSRGVFKQQLKSPVAGSQCDNGSYLEMSCSCKAVIILINYLLWALTHSCGNTYTVSRSAQPVYPFVLSSAASVPAIPRLLDLNFFRLFGFRVDLDPSHLLYSCQVVCDSLSHLFLFRQTWRGGCMPRYTVWIFNLLKVCVWFTSLDILWASELGQLLHSLPCPHAFAYLERERKLPELVFNWHLISSPDLSSPTFH